MARRAMRVATARALGLMNAKGEARLPEAFRRSEKKVLVLMVVIGLIGSGTTT
jgi:hypothetical protein